MSRDFQNIRTMSQASRSARSRSQRWSRTACVRKSTPSRGMLWRRRISQQ